MTFDNSKSIISIRIKLFAMTIIVLAYLILAYVASIIKFPFLGFSETVWTVILICIWIFIALLPMLLNYQYIFFSDDTEKIIIRYFNAGIVGGKKNSLEIDKTSFSGYKTETSLLGLRTSIVLFQKFAEGVAKYPPVWISALSRDEKSKLYRALNSYVHQSSL
jgi:hypothetical protein